MHEPVLTQHERVAAYSQKQILRMTQAAQAAAWDIMEELGAMLTPGITEAQMREAAYALFEARGIDKNWHRPYIYFGAHTVLTAYDPKPKDSLTLREEDIAYIDIGPVIMTEGVEVEGDVGRTWVFGENPLFHELQRQSERIDALARQYWREKQPTGVELYEYIHRLTEEAGFQFQLAPAGHLIGAFPHLGWKDGLNTYPYIPEPGIWILEIQLRHPTEPCGAFYEAVLV